MRATELGHRFSAGAPALLAVCLVALGALAGCTDGQPDGTVSTPSATSSSPTPEPSDSPSASPTTTLTPEEQQAVAEATAAVLAYRQTIVDLLSGARQDLNDLNAVATGDLLARDQIALQQQLASGWQATPVQPDSQVLLAWASPVSVSMRADPPSIRVRACVDLSTFDFIDPDGSEVRGTAGEADYVVVKTAHLPDPGWAVADALGREGDRAC